MSPTPLSRLSSERGSLLIEVLVAAVLVAVMGAALFGALDSSAKVSGTAKARAGAAAVAQDDQERMRAMPIVSLNNLREHRDPVVVGKITYVVDSRADWIADASGGTDCTANGKAADYLKITSTVDAKNVPGLKPVVVTSTVTPAPGTFQGNEGSEAVTVVNRNGLGIPGLTVTIAGPTTASDITDANGCAFFGYEPAGSYTGAVLASGYVNVNGYAAGSANASFGVTIAAGTVSTDQVKFDLGGRAAAHLRDQAHHPARRHPAQHGDACPPSRAISASPTAGSPSTRACARFGDGTPQYDDHHGHVAVPVHDGLQRVRGRLLQQRPRQVRRHRDGSAARDHHARRDPPRRQPGAGARAEPDHAVERRGDGRPDRDDHEHDLGLHVAHDRRAEDQQRLGWSPRARGCSTIRGCPTAATRSASTTATTRAWGRCAARRP